jgi:HlyD family secretion protein
MKRPALPHLILSVALGCSLAAAAALAADNIGAIGQIVPAGGVINVNGLAGGMVREVRVHAGDAVKAGDLLLVVDSSDPKADRALAQTQLDGEKKLARQQIATQALAVRLAERRVDQASHALQRYQALGANSTSLSEKGRLESEFEQAQLALQIEQSKLQVTGTESDNAVRSAQRQVEIASANSDIRAPIAGTVLRVSRRAGERIGAEPAVQIADLRTMYVDCQVYEGDLLKLSPGMAATIKSPALKAPLHGRIDEIGRMIDAHAKLGDVRIKLDLASPADRLVGMEVEVSIAP